MIMSSVGLGSKPGHMPNDANPIFYIRQAHFILRFFVVYFHIHRAKYLVPSQVTQMTDPKDKRVAKTTISEPG